MKSALSAAILLIFLFHAPAAREAAAGRIQDEGSIEIYPENPFYWQYKNRPVLLIGGSVDDNLLETFSPGMLPRAFIVLLTASV
jgi:hypothetical protein